MIVAPRIGKYRVIDDKRLWVRKAGPRYPSLSEALALEKLRRKTNYELALEDYMLRDDVRAIARLDGEINGGAGGDGKMLAKCLFLRGMSQYRLYVRSKEKLERPQEARGGLERALDDLGLALVYDKRMSEAYVALAEIWAAEKNFGNSIRCMRSLLKIEPASISANYVMGGVLECKLKCENASEIFGLVWAPGCGIGRHYMAAEESFRRSNDKFVRVAAWYLQNEGDFVAEASHHMLSGNWQAAIFWLEAENAARENSEINGALHFALGISYANSRRIGDAVAGLGVAREIYPLEPVFREAHYGALAAERVGTTHKYNLRYGKN